MWALRLLAQAGDGGFQLPESSGEWMIWVGIAVMIGALWGLVRRTRRRAQEQFRTRLRAEEEERRRRLGEP